MGSLKGLFLSWSHACHSDKIHKIYSRLSQVQHCIVTFYMQLGLRNNFYFLLNFSLFSLVQFPEGEMKLFALLAGQQAFAQSFFARKTIILCINRHCILSWNIFRGGGGGGKIFFFSSGTCTSHTERGKHFYSPQQEEEERHKTF